MKNKTQDEINQATFKEFNTFKLQALILSMLKSNSSPEEKLLSDIYGEEYTKQIRADLFNAGWDLNEPIDSQPDEVKAFVKEFKEKYKKV